MSGPIVTFTRSTNVYAKQQTEPCSTRQSLLPRLHDLVVYVICSSAFRIHVAVVSRGTTEVYVLVAIVEA